MNGSTISNPYRVSQAQYSASALGSERWLDDDGVWRVVALGVLGAFLLHGVAAVRLAYIHAEIINWSYGMGHVVDGAIARRLMQTIEIDVPEEKKIDEPKPPEDKPDEPPPPVVKNDNPPPAAPPAAAQAGAVLTAPDDNSPLDLTNSFVTGTSDRYAGGTTQAGGTSNTAVRNPGAVATGAPHGTGTGPGTQQGAVDRSRALQLAGSNEWHCPFPAEADSDQIDEAAAVVSVTVGADGKPQKVSVTQDPGHGFGREARACALRESYVPALDREGNPIASSKSFRVHFER
ncbi:MAG TPA: energy transducer TonB [Polyangiaceae bacterium]